MRILVAWASDVSPNLGVRALGRGSVDLLKTVWPGAEFEFIDFGHRPDRVPLGRVRSLIRERVTGRTGMMEWLRQFDLLWDTRSGDSFADIYGAERHTKMSLLHEFAAQAGVTAIFAPQTIGPFRHARATLIARRNLKRSRVVFARDPISARVSAQLGRNVDATVTDLVFGIQQPAVKHEHGVLLNVSGLLWQASDHIDHAGYRATVRAIISGLIADGRRVTLLPHVLDSHDPDNDVPVSRALEDEFDGAVDVHVPEDLDDVRSAVVGAELVIGARMHACLNALSTGTPAIAMAYSRKFEPLMTAIQWPHVISLAESINPAREVLSVSRTDGLARSAETSRAIATELLEPVHTLLDGVL